MKILLIDDDDVDRHRTRRALSQSGYSITISEARSAKEGLAMALKDTFDIIILDYHLPTMTGLDLLKTLRATGTHHSAVIMLSHTEDESLAIRCIEAGAQDFIIKMELTASRIIRAILHTNERFRIERELRESHERLRFQAEIDSLTGIANRYMFELSLKNAIPLAKRHHKNFALVMLDLDNFKHVNDSLGHAAGDVLLKAVAKRLQAQVRDGDLLSRLGGDEFAILVHNLDKVEQARLFANRILASLISPVRLADHDITVSASIGIATFPDCATNAASLMKCADVAMYRSKDNGRNQIHFYSGQLHAQIKLRVELEQDLRKAMENDEFTLQYQPQFSPETEAMMGVETLIRWQHPRKGLIPANDFMPIAEDIGLVEKINAWALDTACDQFAQWRARYPTLDFNLSVSINLSTFQVNQSDFLQCIDNTLARHSIPHQRLEFEIKERTLSKSSRTTAILNSLSAKGITLALADFGTGYSSLTQLKEYPFQVLKINKTFIHSIADNPEDALFLKAIKAFSKTLGLKIIAKGVETQDQKNLCKGLNFDRLQGFYYAKPVSAKLFEQRFLMKNR